MVVLLAPPRGRVVRYSCLVTFHGEILCHDPVDGGLFRPERRLTRFVIEAPAL
jgi:hypothetical protein